MKTIELIERHARNIAEGRERVKPGMPYRISEATCVGEGVWQGDLGIEIVASVPNGHVLIERPTDVDRQLVPGNTVGSRHCLASLSGVKLYRRADWSAESLVGPCIVCESETTITHPTHGAVTIPAGFTVALRYQRVWEAEQRKARRAAD